MSPDFLHESVISDDELTRLADELIGLELMELDDESIVLDEDATAPFDVGQS